jgi:hypothetical protein
MYKIVVAIRPEDAEAMRQVLGDEFDLVLCTSLSEAKAALTPDVDMIACGVHFDDGRMFDLLKYTKASEALSGIPFWGVLRDGGVLSHSITRGIRTAMKTLGASGLFDLSRMAPAPDGQAGFRQFRALLRKSLAERGREEA